MVNVTEHNGIGIFHIDHFDIILKNLRTKEIDLILIDKSFSNLKTKVGFQKINTLIINHERNSYILTQRKYI